MSDSEGGGFSDDGYEAVEEELPIEDEEAEEQGDDLEDANLAPGFMQRNKMKPGLNAPEERKIVRKRGNEADAFLVESLVEASRSYHSQGQIKTEKSRGPNIRLTTPYMSKYEKARILGSRALQLRYLICCKLSKCCFQPNSFKICYNRLKYILSSVLLRIISSLNAPVLVETNGETDPHKIAIMELEAHKIPFVVRRFLPDGSYEDWAAHELMIKAPPKPLGHSFK
ncbi:subunit common to RNA polymerases I, II, and III [Entomophthora muscae]|uniref:Subunit common to RNA polymerases I, II, and III n=1 Tax=Entomophthora muscae TaxID=34485 RepID=A0ACC2T9N0_9FUNG|nr:subunit common to RNA polymerases I, II, and III [Entomophthora muscae]